MVNVKGEKNDIQRARESDKACMIKCCHLGNLGGRHTGINSLYYFCNFSIILKLFQNKVSFKKNVATIYPLPEP